jgi:ferredoxin
MGTVTFLSMVLPEAVTVRFPDHERPTLLGLAQGHGIPLHCDCLNEGCGRCAVKVAAVRPASADTVSLSAAEKDTLWRAGRLTPEQYRAKALAADTPLWRLACQVVACDEDIWVAF